MHVREKTIFTSGGGDYERTEGPTDDELRGSERSDQSLPGTLLERNIHSLWYILFVNNHATWTNIRLKWEAKLESMGTSLTTSRSSYHQRHIGHGLQLLAWVWG